MRGESPVGRTERLTEVLNPDEDWGSLVCATEPIAWNSAPYASCRQNWGTTWLTGPRF